MARYQCRDCGFDGHAVRTGDLLCPHCGSRTGVRAAIRVEEMTEEDLAAIKAAIPGEGDRAAEG
jgi:predicted RNA-binding Zn-ribbon protein involved in translation (DUF1610 family)